MSKVETDLQSIISQFVFFLGSSMRLTIEIVRSHMCVRACSKGTV
jgi:hypothetical protein